MWIAGPQVLVSEDWAARARRDRGGVKVERLGVRRAPNCDQKRIAFDRPLLPLDEDTNTFRGAVLLDAEIGDTEQHIDAFAREYVMHHIADFGIVALEHSLAALDERDPAAHMADQLPQL